jgi:hypothetical protein
MVFFRSGIPELKKGFASPPCVQGHNRFSSVFNRLYLPINEIFPAARSGVDIFGMRQRLEPSFEEAKTGAFAY